MSDQGRIEYEAPESERGFPTNGETRARSTSGLVSDLIGETSALLQAEAALARAEMRDNVTNVRRGATFMGSGTALLHAGLLALVACAVFALMRVWPDWLAALVVGLAVAAIGGGLIAAGKRKALGHGLTPERTIDSLHEMRELARAEKQRAMRKWQ